MTRLTQIGFSFFLTTVLDISIDVVNHPFVDHVFHGNNGFTTSVYFTFMGCRLPQVEHSENSKKLRDFNLISISRFL